MPFSMGDEKGIDIDARLRSSMPSGTPACHADFKTALVFKIGPILVVDVNF